MHGICKKLVGKVNKDAEAISLIKGMEVKKDGPSMVSSLISSELGINCCVLMGANIANEASSLSLVILLIFECLVLEILVFKSQFYCLCRLLLGN